MDLRVLPGYQYLVDNAVLYRVLGAHEKVALGVVLDHVDRLLAVLVRVLGLEEQELRHDQVGGDLGHRPDQEHHALLQQPGIDVVGALAAPRLLDDHRDQPEVLGLRCRAFPVHALPPISSSKETGLSTAFAFDKTHLTTLASRATPSISDKRCGCI